MSIFDDEEKLKLIVSQSYNIQECINKFGLYNIKGNNHKTLKKYIKLYNIDISHFNPYLNRKSKNKKSLEDIFKGKDNLKSSSNFKQRLYKEGYKKEICEECGQLPIWNNKPLVLHLDHINGINSDNRLENLRILCPHCHSQTSTYCNKKEGLKNNEKKKILKKSLKETKLQEKIDLVKKQIENENIDLSIKNWGAKLSKTLNLTPQATLKWIKKHIINTN